MHILRPRQISGEIMTLIEEADKKVIIVTPYFKVKNWHKMINCLNSIKSRRIPCEIYVREGEHESIREVRSVGFEPILIPNLHTKLYINEKACIVSSMNILMSSDSNSLDIAIKTDNAKEYDELWDYYLRYIQNSTQTENVEPKSLNWTGELEKNLSKATGRTVHITEKPNNLIIQAGNRYEALIDEGKYNDLIIVGILSGNEFDYASKFRKTIESKNLTIKLSKGGNGYYDTVQGCLSGLKTTSINQPTSAESKTIVSAITEFVSVVEQLKKRVRENY